MDRNGASRGRVGAWGDRANTAAHTMAQQVDDSSGEASQRFAGVLVLAVRLLRIPTFVVWFVPIPALATIAILGLTGDGWFAAVLIVMAVLLGVVSAAFFGRRRRILQAVDDPQALADELRQMFNLTGRLDDGKQVLGELTAAGGNQTFGRVRAAWRGVSLPAYWLDQIGELKRARYFAPPKIGTTVTVVIAALWLVPISIVIAVFAMVGALAGTL